MCVSDQPYIHWDCLQLRLCHQKILFLHIGCNPLNCTMRHSNVDLSAFWDTHFLDPPQIILSGMLRPAKRRINNDGLLRNFNRVWLKPIQSDNVIVTCSQSIIKILPDLFLSGIIIVIARKHQHSACKSRQNTHDPFYIRLTDTAAIVEKISGHCKDIAALLLRLLNHLLKAYKTVIHKPVADLRISVVLFAKVVVAGYKNFNHSFLLSPA